MLSSAARHRSPWPLFPFFYNPTAHAHCLYARKPQHHRQDNRHERRAMVALTYHETKVSVLSLPFDSTSPPLLLVREPTPLPLPTPIHPSNVPAFYF